MKTELSTLINVFELQGCVVHIEKMSHRSPSSPQSPRSPRSSRYSVSPDKNDDDGYNPKKPDCEPNEEPYNPDLGETGQKRYSPTKLEDGEVQQYNPGGSRVPDSPVRYDSRYNYQDQGQDQDRGRIRFRWNFCEWVHPIRWLEPCDPSGQQNRFASSRCVFRESRVVGSI